MQNQGKPRWKASSYETLLAIHFTFGVPVWRYNEGRLGPE
jgi:hypothetical protein